MKASRSPALLMLVTVFAASAVLSCGRKTSPQIPDSPRPAVVGNITATTRDAVAYLSWTIPSTNAEEKPIAAGDIRKFRIYRAETGPEKRKARPRLYHEIDLDDPSPAVIKGSTVTWSDEDMEYGQTYSYLIRAVSARGGVSSWSAEARAMPVRSLTVPMNVTASAGDGFAMVSWGAVTVKKDGTPHAGFVGYNLYRGTEPGKHDPAPVNREPLVTTEYRDTAVATDTAYYYIVRAVDSRSAPWHESPDSAEVSATPRDRTPPARPTGITVVPGINRVFLTWNENVERDLAGYHIYRSADGGRTFVRLGEAVVTRSTFSDETVQQGATYLYRLTAVDRSGNESEASLELGADIERMPSSR